MHITQYIVRWDFVKFDTYCGGFGYLPEDLNHDCYVDEFDLGMLAGQWLAEDIYGLFEDDEDIVNWYDFTILAGSWQDYRNWGNWNDPNFIELDALLDADLNDDGIVNLKDFAVLTDNWLSGENCIRSNIDCLGAVDYEDLSIMVDEWLQISWLYGLN